MKDDSWLVYLFIRLFFFEGEILESSVVCRGERGRVRAVAGRSSVVCDVFFRVECGFEYSRLGFL